MHGRAAFAPSKLFSGARRMATALGLAALVLSPAGSARAADKAAPAPPPASVGDNIKSLGQQVTDPNSLTRIKAHEQELEKHVETTRDRQRKDHGAPRASDATELATKPSPGEAAPASAGGKRKASATAIKKTDDAKGAGSAKAPDKGKEAATPPAATTPVK
ncbi:MAG TPA: hypothetical protein VGP07_19785 [Polyangia bacterium]|jgi:hypothetical protein